MRYFLGDFFYCLAQPVGRSMTQRIFLASVVEIRGLDVAKGGEPLWSTSANDNGIRSAITVAGSKVPGGRNRAARLHCTYSHTDASRPRVASSQRG